MSADGLEDSERLNDVIMMMITSQRASWEQGVAGQALLEYYQFLTDHPDQDILPKPIMGLDGLERLLYGMAHDAVLRRSTDGRLATRVNSDDQGSADGSALDPACNGQLVAFMIDKMEKEGGRPEEVDEWGQALDDMMGYLEVEAPTMGVPLEELRNLEKEAPTMGTSTEVLVRPLSEMRHDNFVISHTARKAQLWSNGIYMGPPFLATYAFRELSLNKPTWIKRLYSALDQIILTYRYLTTKDSLLMHMFDCESRSTATDIGAGLYGAGHWGVGNGWAMGGIVRVLNTIYRAIKENKIDGETGLNTAMVWELLHPRLKLIAEILTLQIIAVMKIPTNDFQLHNIIDDSSTFVETNLVQMTAATIYRVAYLMNVSEEMQRLFGTDPSTIYDTFQAELMRYWVLRKVDKHGFVTGVASSPRFDRPGTATEGQAWFVLMEVARADYFALGDTNLVDGDVDEVVGDDVGDADKVVGEDVDESEF